jgi:hypothetical protein
MRVLRSRRIYATEKSLEVLTRLTLPHSLGARSHVVEPD